MKCRIFAENPLSNAAQARRARGDRVRARAEALVEQVRGWRGTCRATSRKNKRHNRIVADCPGAGITVQPPMFAINRTSNSFSNSSRPLLSHPRKVSRSMSHKSSLDFCHPPPPPPIFRRLSFPFICIQCRFAIIRLGWSKLPPFFQPCQPWIILKTIVSRMGIASNDLEY